MLTWVGLVFTTGFGVLGVVLYLRGRRTKRIACLITSGTVQKRVHPDVQMSFRGRDVANLSRMIAYFWNVGTEEIRIADVPEEKWPRLILPDGARVLSVAALRVSTDHIHLSAVQASDRAVCVQFQYLNPGDGAVIEVLFEASPAAGSVTFEAPLIGGRSPDFGELPAGVGTDIRLSLLEAAGGLISGMAFFSLIMSSGLNRAVLGAAGVAGGFMMTASAIYLDHHRLHRRLPSFAQRYLQELAAA